jgi:hypothetical protein
MSARKGRSILQPFSHSFPLLNETVDTTSPPRLVSLLLGLWLLSYAAMSSAQQVPLGYHLSAASSGTRLVVHDLTGRVVLTQDLKAEQGEVQLAVKGLAAGLYVVLLQQQGQVLATRRLAITR